MKGKLVSLFGTRERTDADQALKRLDEGLQSLTNSIHELRQEVEILQKERDPTAEEPE